MALMAGAPPVSRWSRIWTLLKRYTLYSLASTTAAAILVALMALPLWQKICTDTIQLLDQHIHHEIAHQVGAFQDHLECANPNDIRQ